MKKICLSACLCLLCILTMPTIVLSETQAIYYVSPKGSDSNDGSLSSPFKTIHKARDEIRNINQSMSGDIIVYLLKGNYILSSPLELTPQDSGTNSHNIIYQSYCDKTAVISGGIQIPSTDWELYDHKKNIYRAYVGTLETRQLYVNEKRAIRAKGPKNPEGLSKTTDGYAYTNIDLPIQYQVMKDWGNKQDIEVVNLRWWKSFRCGVLDISDEIITMKQPCWNNSQLHKPFEMSNPDNPGSIWIENAYELLDEEGEWYLNRTIGYLYYKPRGGENMATAKVFVPHLETLVYGTGTLDNPIQHIQFKGIIFTHAGWLEPNGSDGYCVAQADYRIVGENSSMPWNAYAKE